MVIVGKGARQAAGARPCISRPLNARACTFAAPIPSTHPRCPPCRSTLPLHYPAMTSWDWLTKFVIIGDPAVGKSSLLVRLTDDRFLINPETTIGVEFGSHIVEIEETGERIKCQCWDTAGSETFRSVSGWGECVVVRDGPTERGVCRSRGPTIAEQRVPCWSTASPTGPPSCTSATGCETFGNMQKKM